MVQDARTVLLTAVATVQQHVPALAKAHRNRMDVQTVVVHASLLALAVVKIVRRVLGVQDVHPHALAHVKAIVQELVKGNVLLGALAVVGQIVQVTVRENAQQHVQRHVLMIVQMAVRMVVNQCSSCKQRT